MKVRTEAQFTALNDCNLRLVRVAKYAVMVVSSVVSTGGNFFNFLMQDLDELIVPYQHRTLAQMLAKLDTEKAASFTVQNAFFYLYWENATEVETLVEAAGLAESPGYLRAA